MERCCPQADVVSPVLPHWTLDGISNIFLISVNPFDFLVSKKTPPLTTAPRENPVIALPVT